MSRSRSSKPDTSKPIRILGYGLPRNERDTESRVVEGDEFEFHDEPLGSSVSFLDYDGVVVYAGAFEKIENRYMMESDVACVAPADLDRREREFFTAAFDKGKTFIFLVPYLPDNVEFCTALSTLDLFRRITHIFDLDWKCLNKSSPLLTTKAPEFKEFLRRYGTGYLTFDWSGEKEFFTKLFVGPDGVFGLAIGNNVLFVPCTLPDSHERIIETARAAVSAALRYRSRTSKALPEWVGSFIFREEASLREKRTDLNKQIAVVEQRINHYTALKGALCFQSDPLVEVIASVLERFFGITLTVDEKYVEDATLCDENGEILAVFEIKGVKGSFTRGNVNQVDSHRERLDLPATTPGILIMNTVMSAHSLADKDQFPHPDIIKKAVADNVLMIRTLDLLRYADAVEKGVADRNGLRTIILTKSGWLRVENDTPEVVNG